MITASVKVVGKVLLLEEVAVGLVGDISGGIVGDIREAINPSPQKTLGGSGMSSKALSPLLWFDPKNSARVVSLVAWLALLALSFSSPFCTHVVHDHTWERDFSDRNACGRSLSHMSAWCCSSSCACSRLNCFSESSCLVSSTNSVIEAMFASLCGISIGTVLLKHAMPVLVRNSSSRNWNSLFRPPQTVLGATFKKGAAWSLSTRDLPNVDGQLDTLAHEDSLLWEILRNLAFCPIGNQHK